MASNTASRKGRLQASAVNSRAGDAACFLHSLTASLNTSRAVACQGRLWMAERVLPLPQPSSSTRDPAGRSGTGGGAPFHRRPLSLYSSSQARRCSGREFRTSLPVMDAKIWSTRAIRREWNQHVFSSRHAPVVLYAMRPNREHIRRGENMARKSIYIVY